ncbi:MAG: phosphogluconate dehydrogenase (NADP(+)-dependent, decarboxylating) [Gammaproteobacteria bacterium CG_4_10_14_0_8_um_filter_38_16]|nr:MAG: phosphogluconate dehydrogenase (NADP(+)-dependent, decarboxylating) [Gammaproteobacteria bacterium CG_4_10_14_0_8_um_filter_38_16]PJA02821.1 MAG: phosphogluconate dehydrogenase (NADP(+)-dependent, decarboxylating) [Gammaproteobacteria bacterium CG_4_10_14_0_2_um_filter_38_22]PJB09655.1 MAG: phosphogluconate dehydrogenase (NADP(+)-dependent, decarboxylating) [Gammaproteobacteria bacterium CG_4_9_14_3_um_filter_38_9]
MTNKNCDIGLIGLGVMGQNLLLNMADHGFVVAGYEHKTKAERLRKAAKKQSIYLASDIAVFLNLLKKPRTIMLLVPAGKIVDSVIDELLPHLESGDLIIDAGNSHFTDTDRRTLTLQKSNILFLGVGISGGEAGARRGPSIMPGGSKKAYEQVRTLLEAIAAKVNNDPCVTYLGEGSVGHYVKMVHNGIEYGMMQLIAETYDLMKRGLGFNNQQLQVVYDSWNHSELSSYLLEITSHIFSKVDEKTHQSLIDEIKGIAAQNGTGMWTSQSAMELQVPTPIIDLAVMMRDLSVLKNERESANALYQQPAKLLDVNHNAFLMHLKNAFYTAMTVVYAQGMALLKVASEKYHYQLNLESVARIWRGGCIIRATLLEDICSIYQLNNKLPNLLLDPNLSKKIIAHQDGLRHIVSQASASGIPVPTMMATLSYFDAYRSSWQPANLIQAQRDYFGSHRYERMDSPGTFHTEWE